MDIHVNSFGAPLKEGTVKTPLKHAAAKIELCPTSIETRLENNEIMQRATAQRLDEIHKSMIDRLGAKDDTINRLKEQGDWVLKQNDTLLKQIGLRWNLLTGLTTLVGLAFTITLGYQIWRVEQVMDTKRALEQGTALLAQNTNAYSKILSTLAHADTLMTEGNREFQRAEYKQATNLATRAIGLLTSALQTTGFEVLELQKQAAYDSATCSANASFSSVSQRPSPESDYAALNPKVLKKAVVDALFTAYDLHARATFFSTNRDELRPNGMILLALDDSRWEGYHWIGLAAEAEGEGSFAEATACFRRSVERNKIGNKDYINLAELSFIRFNYSDATTFSEQYLRPLGHRFKSPVDVVAQFYYSAAGLLSDNVNARSRMPPETFHKKVAKLREFTLEGTFSPSDLINFLKSSEFEQRTPSEKIGQVRQLAACLIDRTCQK